MAKVNVSVDTEAKTLSVELNGVKLADIAGVSIYNWGCCDEPRYSIRLSTETKDDTGVRTITEHMMDCEIEESEAKLIASEIEGFQKRPALTPVQEQIRKWLKN